MCIYTPPKTGTWQVRGQMDMCWPQVYSYLCRCMPQAHSNKDVTITDVPSNTNDLTGYEKFMALMKIELPRDRSIL